MGFNATVVLMVDAAADIEQSPTFGRDLVKAVMDVQRGKSERQDVQAGCHANAATVVEVHHADSTAVLTVGGNLGICHLEDAGWDHHTEEGQIRLLKAWAKKLGFAVVRPN